MRGARPRAASSDMQRLNADRNGPGRRPVPFIGSMNSGYERLGGSPILGPSEVSIACCNKISFTPSARPLRGVTRRPGCFCSRALAEARQLMTRSSHLADRALPAEFGRCRGARQQRPKRPAPEEFARLWSSMRSCRGFTCAQSTASILAICTGHRSYFGAHGRSPKFRPKRVGWE